MTEVDICNLALLRLNKSSISELTDNQSLQAKACKLAYPQSRRSLISDYIWNFSTCYKQLQPLKYLNFDEAHQPPFNDGHPRPDPTDPTTYKNLVEYAFLYGLPQDFLFCIDLHLANHERVPLIRDRKPPYDIRHFSNPSGSNYSLPEITYLFSDHGEIPTYAGEKIVHPTPPNLKYSADISDTTLFPSSFIDCLVISLALQLAKYFVDSLQYIPILMSDFERKMEKAMINDCKQLILQYDFET
ncbi:MAG: hypothetical protein LBD81_00495 [Holosporaceae bacterium]|jgi:hypothetical protein|nr:hypothetical protein [Holosporaceae bacterium]